MFWLLRQRTGLGPALVACLLAACAEQSASFLAWPEEPSARTAIITSLQDGQLRAEVAAVQAGVIDRARMQLDQSEATSVELYFYDRALDLLGLTPGFLEPQSAGIRLTDPRTGVLAHLHVVAGDTDTEFQWAAAPEATADAVRLPERSVGCAPFEVEVLESGLPGDPLLIEINELGEHRVLFRGGDYLPFAGDPVSLVSYQLLAGARIGDRWWALDAYASLYDFDPDAEPSARVLSLLAYGDMSQGYWLAGDAQGARVEVYSLSQSGALQLWDGQVRTTVHELPASAVDYHDRAGGLVWLEPGQVLAAWASNPDVFSFQEGRLSMEKTGAELGLVSLRLLPSGRMMAGDAGGAVYLRSVDGVWSAIRGHEVALWPLSFGEYDDSLVYGTAIGHFVAYQEGVGFCAPVQPYAGATFRVMTVAGDAVYLGGTATGGGVILKLRRP